MKDSHSKTAHLLPTKWVTSSLTFATLYPSLQEFLVNVPVTSKKTVHSQEMVDQDHYLVLHAFLNAIMKVADGETLGAGPKRDKPSGELNVRIAKMQVAHLESARLQLLVLKTVMKMMHFGAQEAHLAVNSIRMCLLIPLLSKSGVSNFLPSACCVWQKTYKLDITQIHPMNVLEIALHYSSYMIQVMVNAEQVTLILVTVLKAWNKATSMIFTCSLIQEKNLVHQARVRLKKNGQLS